MEQLLEENRDLRVKIASLEMLEDKFQKTERASHQVLDAINDMILVKGPGSKILWANKAFQDYYGMTNVELENLIDAPFNEPRYTEQYLEDDAYVFSTGNTLNIPEEPVTCHDGTVRYFNTVKSPILDAHGRVFRLVAVCRDITGQKEAEFALNTLNRQHNLILKSAGEGIYGLDKEGRITFINPAAAQMIGSPISEILGQFQHDVLHHSHPDGTPFPRGECAIYAALRNGDVHSIDSEFFWKKDGTCFPVQYTSTPLRNDQGDLEGAVVVFRDISDRRQAEEIIRKSERRWHAIYDQAPTGMAIIDSYSGQFLDINKRYCDILGYSEEEMLAHTFHDITHSDDLQSDLDNMQRLLSGEIPTFQMDKRYIRKDGQIIWVALTCVPLWLEAKDRRSHIAIVEDITEQKQNEEQFTEQQAKLRSLAVEVSLAEERERKRIASVLHDDIGQNLALLKLKLGFLGEIHPSIRKSGITGESHDLLGQIIRSTRTLTYGLVSPLLYELGFEEGIKNLCEQVQDRHPEMHLSLHLCHQPLKLSDQVSIVLFRIIRELLFNIEKHAQATNVELNINARDGKLFITLDDNGVGFKCTDMEKGFSAKGGFGLFSIQEQVRGLGGSFNILSTLGKGTQVVLQMSCS
jgi:PAS domain S-box-containing protein